jgi:hypothetical protein
MEPLLEALKDAINQRRVMARLQAKVPPMAWHCCSSSSGQRRICSLSTAMAAQWAFWSYAVSERHVSF